MNKKVILGAVVTALFAQPCVTFAASDPELQAIREQIQQLKAAYEERIAALESRLQIAESAVATRVETELAPPAPQAAASGNGNSFNPEISLILSGTYGQFQQNTAIAPTGFAMAANTPPAQGFNLGESELGIQANIDSDYRGVATMALSPAGGVSVENAYVQTSALGSGMNLSFGRFFSGLGYLNAQHAHAWDFTDQPLVYRSFWNNQLGEDGLQLKWLAPTDTFVELGAEIGKGRGFPGTDRAKNGSGASALFAHVGDDFNAENSWQAGGS